MTTKPCEKVTYYSREAAARAREVASSRRGKPAMSKRLTPYQCPQCRRWHLTSSEMK